MNGEEERHLLTIHCVAAATLLSSIIYREQNLRMAVRGAGLRPQALATIALGFHAWAHTSENASSIVQHGTSDSVTQTQRSGSLPPRRPAPIGKSGESGLEHRPCFRQMIVSYKIACKIDSDLELPGMSILALRDHKERFC